MLLQSAAAAETQILSHCSIQGASSQMPGAMQLVTLAPLSPGYTEPCTVLGCQDYTIRVVDRSVPIHQVTLCHVQAPATFGKIAVLWMLHWHMLL